MPLACDAIRPAIALGTCAPRISRAHVGASGAVCAARGRAGRNRGQRRGLGWDGNVSWAVRCSRSPSNSVYLAARADATLFYFANVALHVGLGAAVARGDRLAGSAALGRPRPPLARGGSALRRGGRARPAADGDRHDAALTARSSTRTSRSWRRGALVALVAAAAPAPSAHGGIARLAVAAALLALATPIARGVADLRPPRHVIANPELPPLTMDGEGQGRERALLPVLGGDERGPAGPVALLHDERGLRPLPPGDLRPVELLGAPLRVVQQPVVQEVGRVHAGRGRHQALQVVRGLPRPRRADRGQVRHVRSRSRSTRPRPRSASPAPRATRSCTSRARWARATSRSSTRRSTTWP